MVKSVRAFHIPNILLQNAIVRILFTHLVFKSGFRHVHQPIRSIAWFVLAKACLY